ncbi:raftlin family member 2, transcript variant X2 [Columba livia]|uniref:Raftlin family member 2, transcript variant X1 n=1 Tax=Columba livia TaxID=8932 RepID=A0A2I0LXP0_COLLI|nr:raftlin-2 [Columba livia]XP_021145472.1 raftlin-2 [Columba livia]PKK22187.1 raftlin family member 2, transcript variant X1 [Columba livia]PKK22188.1 raftlin family member 2, transcript variant X2 [Columba livia]
MGCGLRKLEDPDDSSPGKIFSTLKRPQVETKTDSAYEYVLLDFTLEASSNPEVIQIGSVVDIASKVEEYYSKGYVVGAVHPVILPVGHRRNFSASHMYRVVLSRLKLSQKQAAPRAQRHPRLVIEECPLTCDTLTNEVVKELLEKVNEAAKRGKKFVGFVMQHFPQPKACNGSSADGSAELESTLGRRNREHRRKNSDENYKNWTEGPLSGHSSESGVEEELPGEGLFQEADFHFGKEVSPGKPHKGDDKLFTVFNVFDDDSACWTYQEGVLSMKVARKGPVISTLEADWLELTTFYYKQGLSLIDSFVHWETSKGDYLPKSLEGLFIYEEEGAGVPGSNRKGNDAIVVEQWTVIEGCEIKTDYGPLLHTLAEFGWLLTCVLPTPIVRHDSEGNLATKQVVFLQRPVMWNSTVQTPDKKSLRQVLGEERGQVSSRSVGSDTAASHPGETGPPGDEFHLSAPKQCWIREGSSHYGGFPGFSTSDGALRELDDGQFDQEDGVTQVTCM